MNQGAEMIMKDIKPSEWNFRAHRWDAAARARSSRGEAYLEAVPDIIVRQWDSYGCPCEAFSLAAGWDRRAKVDSFFDSKDLRNGLISTCCNFTTIQMYGIRFVLRK